MGEGDDGRVAHVMLRSLCVSHGLPMATHAANARAMDASFEIYAVCTYIQLHVSCAVRCTGGPRAEAGGESSPCARHTWREREERQAAAAREGEGEGRGASLGRSEEARALEAAGWRGQAERRERRERRDGVRPPSRLHTTSSIPGLRTQLQLHRRRGSLVCTCGACARVPRRQSGAVSARRWNNAGAILTTAVLPSVDLSRDSAPSRASIASWKSRKEAPEESPGRGGGLARPRVTHFARAARLELRRSKDPGLDPGASISGPR
ncbi:hypothetical protein KM043_012513 [Ampulex compressa]|nr:hypothetical protein KM043_012513 [Ampulex compressa]